MIAWLVALVVVPPLLSWPGVSAEVSHRLSLTVCALGLVGTTITRPALRPLPRLWAAYAAALAGVLTWHHRRILTDGLYFEHFRETALLTDGLLTLVVCVLALWALRQLPVATFRRWLPPLLGTWVLLNAWLAMTQRLGVVWPLPFVHPGQASGVLGIDRALGALGVLVWPWTLLLASAGMQWLVLALAVCGAKGMTWLGLLLGTAWLRPRWACWLTPLAVVALIFFDKGPTAIKVADRLGTWRPLLAVSLVHPWVGWGVAPLTWPAMQRAAGMALPGPRSDWLAMALGLGWPLVLGAWFVLAQLAWQPHRTPQARALRAGVLASAGLGLGSTVLTLPQLAGLWLLALAWWSRELDADPA